MDVSKFPGINASLNTASAIFLLLGYIFIRQRAIKAHTMCMVTAFGTSTLFLVFYLVYHFHHGTTRFAHTGWLRGLYVSILISHTILAVVMVPLVLKTLFRGLTGQFGKHVLIARVTFPIWMYVSVTGVVIYFMLYHL